MPNPKVKQVVLGVCGSIAAYKAGDIIRRLQDNHCEVTVIMTKEAAQFITPLTLSSLSGKNVYSDMFDKDSWRMAHIELARSRGHCSYCASDGQYHREIGKWLGG